MNASETPPPPSGWAAPETVSPPAAASDPATARSVTFSPTSPLGGQVPTPQVPEVESNRRDLVLSAVLLVGSLIAGLASLLPWRDFGNVYTVTVIETGWERTDGSLGHGWAAVWFAVLLAVAGVLIAADRVRIGRIMAVAAAGALIVLAIVEWGLAAGESRTGPGVGLWIEFIVGVGVIFAVGVLEPKDRHGANSC